LLPDPETLADGFPPAKSRRRRFLRFGLPFDEDVEIAPDVAAVDVAIVVEISVDGGATPTLPSSMRSGKKIAALFDFDGQNPFTANNKV
jgi:hypothetical protein